MNLHLRQALHLGALGILSLGLASAGTVFTDDFEGATLGAPPPGGTIAGWSLTPGGANMDIVGPSLGGITCHSGNKCLDTDGTGSVGSATITRSFAVTAGVTYFLSFWYSGSQRNFNGPDSVRVNFGSAAALDLNQAQGANTWLSDSSRSFVAGSTGTATLSFTNLGGADNVGIIIDDVSVTDNTVPEPATFALIGGGLMLLGLRRRK